MNNNTILLNRDLIYRVQRLQQSNAAHYLVLFLFWPFLAFILALNNYTEKSSRRVVYFFLLYYGLTFVNNNTGMDSYRYVLALERTAQLPFSDFFKILGGLYSDTSVDIVQPFITFVISRFTTSGNVYFLVWTALMGYFYLKSINLLVARYQRKPALNGLILMIFFIFITPITAITGVRMPTAMWIFFYAAYHVILYRDKRYLLLALSASLVHWSFITVNALLFIYYFAGNRNIIYIPIAILSFILPNLLMPFFSIMASKAGGVFLERFKGYSSEGYIEKINQFHQTASWFMNIMDNSLFYFLVFAIVIIQLTSGKYFMRRKSEKNLFSFLLLLVAFVNFGHVIPSFGSRFQILFYLFATLYLFIYFCNKGGWKISYINIIGLFPMLLYSAVVFRIGSETINVLMFAPIFGLPLFMPQESLAQLLFY